MCCFLLLLILACAPSAAAEPLPPLTEPGHPGWQEKVFAGRTLYSPAILAGQPMLLAEASGTASGLYREQWVDLRSTPWLNWSWKIESVLDGVDERQKSGDDYPARIYVVAKGGLAFWKTRALSYVWASREPVGSMWPNAFTSNAVMIAVQGGPIWAGELLVERRNVREDWKRAFGQDIEGIDAVAIMTDTDNSGQKARAWYGTPWFSRE